MAPARTAILLLASLWAAPHHAPAAEVADGLESPQTIIARFQNNEDRARALFLEAGKVFTSPRCLNCHPQCASCKPKDLAPTQGEDRHPHDPPVKGGATEAKDAGTGVPGLPCATCHHEANDAASGMPGFDATPLVWALAPKTMGWSNSSIGEICRKLQDPNSAGENACPPQDATCEKLIDHLSRTPNKHNLVNWAWSPGGGRRPAPGSQDRFIALITAWRDAGRACPVD